MNDEMKSFVRSFKKIVPSIRSTNLDTILMQESKGELFQVPLPANQVDVYIHRAKAKHAPVVFEFHGGGFVLGDARKDDLICEILKEQANVTVIGVNYRKAPEYPYPCAIEDTLGVLNYFAEHSEEFGIDPNKFLVMGFSAGANLATVAAMKAKECNNYQIISQILHYPYVKADSDLESNQNFATDLPLEIMEAFRQLYSNPDERTNPFVSPIYATKQQLTNMPATLLLTAEFDSLKKEGKAYYQQLVAAQVDCQYQEIKHAHHGYIEDCFNEACLLATPEDTLAKYDPAFKEAANEALEITIEHIKKIVN